MKHLFTLGLLFSTLALFAQKPYFQQEANYVIAVTLDDRAHTLTGNIAIEYVNNSPDALTEIWMHCWPNAFASNRSAFAREQLRKADGEFYFTGDHNRGGLEKLDFRVDGQTVKWEFDRRNPDIARLTLAQPLAPGRRLSITTPFVLNIPASFSRLGHVGQTYQITQWFPKPAVYDARGWHPIPYLDQGEFFSEFGSFDVSITLPENYVVGATGVLQNAAEWQFLRERNLATLARIAKGDTVGGMAARKKYDFPISSTTLKTLRYTAQNVHDFAWFADKQFNVMRDTARLASGRTVECWAMFPNEEFSRWTKGAFYVRRAVEFYSQHVGEYPWPQATALHSALSAGGGMEYPMITVIGNTTTPASLDEVITHEVGHNWFYGILASNERDHPWMDEGLNTYYELRYMLQYHGGSTTENVIPKRFYNAQKLGPLLTNAYLMLARNHLATPPDTRSDRFFPAAYGLEVYMKTALCLNWLEKSVGTEKFDAAMQAYFRDWKFRHPYPEDLRASWQKAGLEADWFFQAMQTEKQTDYALKDVEKVSGGYRLRVKNRQALNAPFPVTALRQGQPVATQWFPAPAKRSEDLVFAVPDADAFTIDRDFVTLDLHRNNNTQQAGSGLFSGNAPLRLAGLAPLEYPGRRTIGFLPWMGWNNYDKYMLGLVAYNPPFPGQRLQYYIAPAYAFGSKALTGLIDLRYKIYPGGAVPKITIGVSGKSFHADFRATEFWRYYRVVPQVRAELRSNALPFRHWLNFRTLFIGQEAQVPDVEGNPTTGYVNSTIYEVRYEAAQKRLPNPYRFTAALEWQDRDNTQLEPARSYLRGSLEWRQRFYYAEKKKVTVRAFAGAFLTNSRRNSGAILPEAFALNPQGFNDYRFDQVFLGRSEEKGIFSRQVSQTQGGFKNAFGSPFAGYASSNSFIAALNLKTDLPFHIPFGLPIKPYFDLGYFDDATPTGEETEQFLWSGGLLFEFFGGGLEVYFPLVNAKPFQDLYKERGGYRARLTWSVRLGAVEPTEIVDGLLR